MPSLHPTLGKGLRFRCSPGLNRENFLENSSGVRRIHETSRIGTAKNRSQSIRFPESIIADNRFGFLDSRQNPRAFGDFETDLKRSDSGSIPDRKVCFLAFICSLNTFQSKNSPRSLSSLYFQLDLKKGKRAQKLQEETVNPLPSRPALALCRPGRR